MRGSCRTTMATIICLAVALSIAGAQPVFEARFDSGAGEAPEGWRFLNQRGECSGAWDRAEPPDNGGSLRCDIPADATARATWAAPRIELKGGAAYRLRLRVMLGEVTEGAKGAYVILYEDGVPAPDHWHMTGFMRGSQDWHERELTFVTRPETTWGELQCKLWECTGYAWFDDIVLEEIDPAEAETVETTALVPPPDDRWPLQLVWYPAQRRPDRTLHLLPGQLNPVSFFAWGRADEITEPHLIVEAPEGITLAGEVVCGRALPPEPVEVTPEPAMRDGERLLRWRLPIRRETLVRGMKPDGPNWERYHFIYVEPGPDAPAQFTWRWALENAGEVGPEHEIAARLVEDLGPAIEPVPGFDLYAQHSSALRHPTEAGRERILEWLHYAGIRGGLALSYWSPEMVPIDDELAGKGWFAWTWAWYGYGGPAVEGQELIDETGAPSRRATVCPQVQAEMHEPHASWLREFYATKLALDRRWLILNYEPPVFNVCFCERCRRAFAEFAGLAADAVLGMTPREIQALPDHAWGRFRAWQNERIIKNHAAIIREIAPDCRFGVCGPAWTQWTADRGMDIRRFEPDVFLHAPMIYRDPLDFEPLIRSTCENTDALVMPFTLGSDLAVPGVFPDAWDQQANMLATALSGGDGVILWVGIESLDAEIMNALRSSMEQIRVLRRFVAGAERGAGVTVGAEVAKARTVTVDGREIVVAGENTLQPVRDWQWRGPNGRMIALTNYDREQPHTVRLVGEGIAEAQPLFGPAPEVADGDVVLQLAPGEFAALTW